MSARNALAVGVGAVALTLTGCSVPRTATYVQPMPQYYTPGAGPPRVVVVPRQQPYPLPAMAQPYTPQPFSAHPFQAQPAGVEKAAAAVTPAKAEPPPLVEVDPPYSHSVDNSCVGAWRICHFLQ